MSGKWIDTPPVHKSFPKQRSEHLSQVQVEMAEMLTTRTITLTNSREKTK